MAVCGSSFGAGELINSDFSATLAGSSAPPVSLCRGPVAQRGLFIIFIYFRTAQMLG